MKTKLFFYDLPEEFIAQKPLEKRDNSRLLVLDKKTGSIKHDFFYNICKYLDKNDILVLNESMVNKCRLEGIKKGTGAKVECFILEHIMPQKNEAFDNNEAASKDNICLVLLKPSRKLKQGDAVAFGEYCCEIIKKEQYGKALVRFNAGPDVIIKKYGKIPLPPYIKNNEICENRYQTIYAKTEGSCAAPTAGLHFTDEVIKSLLKKGVNFAKVLLNIGLDTFRPISAENIEEHEIHSEYYYISKKEAQNIQDSVLSGSRVVSIGTTSARVLETVMEEKGNIQACSGRTTLYIYPGYNFKIVDSLLTNFHLPGSTLIVMVSALAGRENILKAYEEAKNKGYRFFSFGDCMLII